MKIPTGSAKTSTHPRRRTRRRSRKKRTQYQRRLSGHQAQQSCPSRRKAAMPVVYPPADRLADLGIHAASPPTPGPLPQESVVEASERDGAREAHRKPSAACNKAVANTTRSWCKNSEQQSRDETQDVATEQSESDAVTWRERQLAAQRSRAHALGSTVPSAKESRAISVGRGKATRSSPASSAHPYGDNCCKAAANFSGAASSTFTSVVRIVLPSSCHIAMSRWT